MAPENQYISMVFNIIVNDVERQQNTTNWASLVRHLLLPMVFDEVQLGFKS